jgi:ubiquinone/menaquinone biosynthesis C-methylase UbiE
MIVTILTSTARSRRLCRSVLAVEGVAMETLTGISLADVQAVYDGAEGDLWELVMGEQIHIGGFASSMDLAERAGIGSGLSGVDLCCCNGAGMRFLARFRNVDHMTGVDATRTVLERGRTRTEAEGLADRIKFVEADVCDSGLPDASTDFVWGEDAWCYVEDKHRLVAEAARIVKPGGTIAFTDWVAGPEEMDEAESERYLRFMKFPNVLTLDEYRSLLEGIGCRVEMAIDTDRFPAYVDLYLQMLTMQLTYDALKRIGWDTDLMGVLGGEMQFIQQLAHERKISQGLLVAQRER